MDDVSYYDSQVEYQKRVGEIEKERFRLEREMFSMMKSDERLQNLRAAKLRSYWQQICDREKNAHERNNDLLADFNQLEVKLAGMEAQTKKLKSMKLDYEEKVKRMYVKWHQDVEIARAKKQLQDKKLTRLPMSPISSTPKASAQLASDSMHDPALMQPPPAAFADKNSFKSRQFKKSSPESTQNGVMIVPTVPKMATYIEGNVEDDVTDSFSQSDESFRRSSLNQSTDLTQPALPRHQTINAATTVAVHVHKQNSQDTTEQRHSHSNPSLSGTDAFTEDVAKPAEPRPDSKVSSDSFASDLSENFVTVSPKSMNNNSGTQNQALKTSTAYQAMLKQYTGEHQAQEESEDDDFEEIFSGDGTEKSAGNSDDKGAVKSGNSRSLKNTEPVHIPTETSARFSTTSKEKPASHHLHKADWDTDSDEEPEDGYLSNTGGSSRWDQKLRQYDDGDDGFFD